MIDERTLAFAAILAGGALAGLQAPTNGLLTEAVRSPVNAAFVSFAVASIVLAVAALLAGVRPDLEALRTLPWHGWLGGVYGAVFVTAAAYAVSRIGVTTTVSVFLVGQLAMAVLLDQFGAFGLARRPLDLARVVGLVSLVGGALLVRRA